MTFPLAARIPTVKAWGQIVAKGLLAPVHRGNVVEAVQVAGFAAVSYGVWLIQHPAGYIAAGVLAVLEAFSLERAK